MKEKEFQQQADALKNDLTTMIETRLARFHQDTGVMPSKILVHLVDVHTLGETSRRYVFSDVMVQFIL